MIKNGKPTSKEKAYRTRSLYKDDIIIGSIIGVLVILCFVLKLQMFVLLCPFLFILGKVFCNFVREQIQPKEHATFFYKIEEETVQIIFHKILIDDHVYDLDSRFHTIDEMLLAIQNGKKFSCSCTLPKYNVLHGIHPVSKETLLKLCENKKDLLSTNSWRCKCVLRFVKVWNNRIPNRCLAFANCENDPTLLQRVRTMNPEIIDGVLHLKYLAFEHVAVNRVFKDELIANDFVFTAFGYEQDGNPIFFGEDAREMKEDGAEVLSMKKLKKSIARLDKDIEQEMLNTSPLGKMIGEIDDLISMGYQFKNISLDRWTNVYRKECMELLKSSYKMSKEQENDLTSIFTSLRDNLYDREAEDHSVNTDITIKAMQDLLKIDGVENL